MGVNAGAVMGGVRTLGADPPGPADTSATHAHRITNAAPCGPIRTTVREGGDQPISLRFTISLVLSIFCLAVPAWADFQAGVDAYQRGDYATALREWQPLAEQ